MWVQRIDNLRGSSFALRVFETVGTNSRLGLAPTNHPLPTPEWLVETMMVWFAIHICLPLNDVSADIIDREIRKAHSAVERCREARIAAYEDIERRSIQYSVKTRKEATKIVRSDGCSLKPFKILNSQRKHIFPTLQHRLNLQQKRLSERVRVSHPYNTPQGITLVTLNSSAGTASKKKSCGHGAPKRLPTFGVRGTYPRAQLYTLA